MLPKTHLTLHSRMSGSRWVIIPSWLSRSWSSFLYSSSLYSCHLFLISFTSVRSIPFLSLFCPSLCEMAHEDLFCTYWLLQPMLFPCRQHCSTPLVIKILLMPLTGPDNPFLFHCFCCYLKLFCDNEMFTIGNTLNCSYGGVGIAISDLHSLRTTRR